MDSVQTLHDFALNLLNDPTALAAFGADPQGALSAAGLGDVSAADVHEVIPLVLDYLPVDNLPTGGIPQIGDLAALGTDAPQTGIQGAIDQLTALTQGLGLPATPGLPGVGDLPGVGHLPGVGDLAGAVPGVGSLPGLGALPGVNDVTTNAAGVTALAGQASGAFGLGGELAQGLDSNALANLTAAPGYLTDANTIAPLATLAEQPVVGAVGTAHTVGTEVLSATSGPLSEGASHVGDLTGTLGSVTGAVSHVGDLGSVLQGSGDLAGKSDGGEHHGGHGALGVVNNVVTNTTGISVDHNAVGHVGELASDNGSGNCIDAVHDVVSGVSNVSHNALGNLHIGDVASNNDIHIGH